MKVLLLTYKNLHSLSHQAVLIKQELKYINKVLIPPTVLVTYCTRTSMHGEITFELTFDFFSFSSISMHAGKVP